MKFLTALLLLLLTNSHLAYADCPRIISQSPYITHQLDYLGLTNCMVGASRYDATLGLPQTGGVMDPDSSAIAALNPDLWITSTWTKEDTYHASLPANTQGLRLNSFQSMAQISDNLIDIANATRNDDAHQKANAFAHLWQDKLKQVNGQGKRILLLSSCTGQPYSFGNNTWLAELFTRAGFQLVDGTQGVRHLSKNRTAQETQALIQTLNPELIFVFTKKVADACSLIELPKHSQILVLDGDKFLHPAPVLLKGIDQLIVMQPIWQKP